MDDSKVLEYIMDEINRKAKSHGICADNDIREDLEQLVRISTALALSSPLVIKRNIYIMDEIIMQPVISSNIKAVGFSEKDKTMRVMFLNGGTYDAEGATKTDFDTFLAAKSKGVHFNKVLKKAFVWKKSIEKKG